MPNLFLSRRPSIRCTPSRSRQNLPFPKTRPFPIYRPKELLLRSYECINGTHAVGVVRTAFDACERYDTIVEDDTNLFTGFGCAIEN